MYVLKIKQNYQETRFEFEVLDDAVKTLQMLEGNEVENTVYTIEKNSKEWGSQ